MSFTRTKYDKQCYDKYLQSVNDKSKYNLDVPAACSKEGCFNNNPNVRHSALNKSTNMRDINVETSLYNIDYKLGCDKRAANCDDNTCKTQIIGGQNEEKSQDSCDFNTSDTRLDNPASNLRGVGWNRFEWPLTKVPLHENRPINSRNLIKDNYTYDDSQPLDQSNALPEGGDLICPKTNQVCAPFV